MRPRQIVMLVIGCLLLLPGLGLVLGGGALGALDRTGDASGWHTVHVGSLSSAGVAVTTTDASLRVQGSSAALDRIELQVRASVTPTDPVNPLFVGVAPTAELEQYLAGAARDEVVGAGLGGVVTYRTVAGTGSVSPPADQDFWVARATGSGTQTMTWTVRPGDWSIALLNASGVSGVSASADLGARSPALGWLAVTLFVVGVAVVAVAVVLLVLAVRRRGPAQAVPGAEVGGGVEGADGPAGLVPAGFTAVPTPARPVALEARIAPHLSRGLWIVKWFLAIPHWIVLAVLWMAVGVTTVVAWFAILFTGRYPRPLFDLAVGVMRWSWRVAHYCGTGGLGTDRYPPFSLDALPDDDARLDVAYPEHLSRGLIFVKWLLLVPHWIVLALLLGTQSRTDEHGVQVGGWPGVLGILTLVAGIVLLLGGTMPRGLFDVVVGLNRWVYRVMAYALLLTDVYPPFRYDGGGTEPPAVAPPPPPPPPDASREPDAAPEPDAVPEPDLRHHAPTG